MDIPATSDNIPGTLVLRDNSGVASLGAGTVISGNTSTDALRITQEGSGNALVVEDSTNPDSTPLVVNSVGQIISGGTTAFNGVAGLQINADSANAPNANIVLRRNSNDSNAAVINIVKRRGTTSNPEALQTDDNLGLLTFSGYNGSTTLNGAQIISNAEGTQALGQLPSNLRFTTRPSGDTSANPPERMRIDSAGNVGIGTTANAAAILDVASTTKGFLPPRMTTTERDAITSPPAGLMLYNNTTNKLQVRTDTAWVDLH